MLSCNNVKRIVHPKCHAKSVFCCYFCRTQNNVGTVHSDHELKSSRQDRKQHKNNHQNSLHDLCAAL